MIDAAGVTPGALALVLAVAGAAAVGLALYAGLRIGRRAGTRGLREVERGLRALLSGGTEPRMDIPAGDPARVASELVVDLARSRHERPARADRGKMLAAGVLDVISGRGTLVLDASLTILAASGGAARLLGGDAAGLEGRPLQDLVDTESFRLLAASIAESRRARAPFTASLATAGAPARGLIAHGGWPDTPADTVALLIEPPPPADEIAGEPLRGVLERYWAVFAGLPDAVAVVADGAVVEANARALAWLGRDLQGVHIKDLVAVEDVLLVLDRVTRAADGETVDPVPCRLAPIDPELRERDVEFFAAPVRVAGRPAAALVLRDASGEQRADRRAQISDARLLAVLDAAADALLVLSPPAVEGSPWRVALVNKPLLELLGLDGLVVRGAPEQEFRALVAHRFRDPAAFAALFDAAAREPERVHEAALELTGSGSTLEVSLRPVTGLDGELVGRVVVGRDITRHREIERQLVADAASLGRSRDSLQRAYEQLAALNRDLEKKSGELDRLNRELVEIDRARAQLLGDVSHELHTPLVSIRGYCQMILEGRLGKVNDEQRRGLEVALRNVDRMVELINNMIGLSRSETQAALQTESVDPRVVLGAVLERHQDSARRRGVQLDVLVDDPPAFVAAEREGLTRVLDNLVANGIKFNRAGGRVIVTVQPGPAGFVKIEVADTGIGIPPEEQQRVFERFFRGRGAAGTPGSGIGLATVKNVVERHGGAIEVESVAGQGTLFRILWPRESAQTAGNQSPPVSAS